MPFCPMPFHPKPFRPAPFRPAPSRPEPFRPAPFRPGPSRPAPSRPAPFHPKPFPSSAFPSRAAPPKALPVQLHHTTGRHAVSRGHPLTTRGAPKPPGALQCGSRAHGNHPAPGRGHLARAFRRGHEEQEFLAGDHVWAGSPLGPPCPTDSQPLLWHRNKTVSACVSDCVCERLPVSLSLLKATIHPITITNFH